MEVMTVNGVPYSLIRLLGKGKGGYSYLAKDPNGNVAAVKQIHHEPCAYYTFGDKLQSELRDYDRLTALGIPLPRLLAVDEGAERLVKEYIPGPTVYQMVLEGQEIPEEYFRQMEEMCRKLYAAGLNIDYFPTNFIFHEGTLWYVDYECNGYMEQWDFDHWGRIYWSRTPEFISHAEQHGDL